MTTPAADQLTVIFDGTSAWWSLVRRWLGDRAGIAWVVCQATEPVSRGGRLCEQTLVAITGEGEVDTGWRALVRAMSASISARWPYRVTTLPVLCPLMTMAVAGLARLLRRIPGVTPWCAAHPERCRPGA